MTFGVLNLRCSKVGLPRYRAHLKAVANVAYGLWYEGQRKWGKRQKYTKSLKNPNLISRWKESDSISVSKQLSFFVENKGDKLFASRMRHHNFFMYCMSILGNFLELFVRLKKIQLLKVTFTVPLISLSKHYYCRM